MRRTVTSHLAVSMSCSFLAALAFGLAGTAARAEDTVFDWGDNDKTVDSGKAHIKFTGPARAGDIIVSFGDRKLYFITGPGEADTYPIAIPRDQSRWEGVTTVSQKRENPSWTPTAHMMAENPKLPRWVPGGHPMNPLGIRAMYLGSSDYRIHGTDAPWTIGTAASKGCVRMFNKDVVDLYPRVKIGSKVTVTWQKFDSKTLAMAEHATAVSDPDPDHGHGGKALSDAGEDSAETPRATKPKAKKVAAEDDSASDQGEGKSPSAHSRGDKEPQSHKMSADAAAGAQAESSTPPPDGDAGESKPRRSAKRVSHIETGSINDGDGNSDEAAALVVAKRAVAAAEKAAKAAERAAAAAERAAAATQDHASAAAAAAPTSAGIVKSY